MSTSTATSKQTVSFKSVTLPAEHGSWGFLLEPILLGLIVAPSIAGLTLSIAAVSGFLIHQPLKIALKDRLKGKRYARSILAERFALIYGLTAIAALIITVSLAGFDFFAPLLLAVPLILIQLWYDAQNQSRALIPELTGALALNLVAPAIVLIGGWTPTAALLLGVILALRVVTTILYVRSRLRLERDKPAQTGATLAIHSLAFITAGILAVAALTPWLAALLTAILLARATLGLSPYRQSVPPKVIGFRELGYGLLTVVLVAVGYLAAL